MSIVTEIIIDAPVAEVKEVFFDFPGHENWNPFFKSIKVVNADKPDVGTRLSVYMQPENGSAMTFSPTVLENSEKEFAWRGTLFFEFLATGRHYFQFIPVTENGKEVTKLIQGEDFGGLIFYLMKGIIRDTEVSFNKLNVALKEKVEGKPSS
ncbi:hypothetical protein CLIB1423_04S02168 [[Candida] railenensis]|uniref:SRPBCC domain-containing protein n=1 Tax=[Candida] railenensis TaxID=45579 RepID=A0A9P0VWR9_9ASCO|nr:hypothetical protein CLIB1423_04S02168 [[Candida] railenensis]